MYCIYTTYSCHEIQCAYLFIWGRGSFILSSFALTGLGGRAPWSPGLVLHRSTRPADLVASFNPKILYFLELLEFRIFPKLSRGEIKTKQLSAATFTHFRHSQSKISTFVDLFRQSIFAFSNSRNTRPILSSRLNSPCRWKFKNRQEKKSRKCEIFACF